MLDLRGQSYKIHSRYEKEKGEICDRSATAVRESHQETCNLYT
jgi:hypothetical protein